MRVGNVDAVTQTYGLPSPIDGEVLLRNISPGIEVQGQYSGGTAAAPTGPLAGTLAAGELFEIGELDKVWIVGDLYEMDLARVHVGAPVQVTVVAYPDKVFSGTVERVSGSFDQSTRTARVRCTFDNPERLLRPMMYATAQISVDQKNAIAIPRNALLRLGDAKVVFIRTAESDGLVRFKRVAVDVDEGESSPWLEVKHGLEPGQNIVVNGAILLASKL